MVATVPSRIDPRALARAGAELSGDLEPRGWQRLREATVSPGTSAHYRLSFAIGASGATVIEGNVDTEVVLRCQRCLGDYAQPLHATVRVEVVADADADTCDPAYEPLVADGAIALAEWLETELLLALPLVAAHGEGECDVDGRYRAMPEDTRRPSPFAALKDWKPD